MNKNNTSASFMNQVVSTCMLSLSLPAKSSVWFLSAPPCPPLPHKTMRLNAEELSCQWIGTCWNWCFNSIMSSSGFYKMEWVGFCLQQLEQCSLELSSIDFIEKVLVEQKSYNISIFHEPTRLVSTCMRSLSLPASASVWISSAAPSCPTLPHKTMKLNTEEPWRTLFPVKDIGTCWNMLKLMLQKYYEFMWLL